MVAFRLNWFGPPSVEYDGRPQRLEMRKTLALLAYLSLSAQPHSRETLAAMFWPEYDQQHAMANLRRNLSSLARSLPSGLLEVDRERIGLQRVEWLQVDTEEFKEQLTSLYTHSHPEDQACLECLSSLEKAVALYKGDFFEGFNLKDCPEFDDWQFFQRENLRSDYGGALQKLADYYQNQCDWDKAIARTRSWLALDRLHEAPHRKLMMLYYLIGQKSAALRQYEDCKQILEQELGEDPEEETQKVYEEIRSGSLYEGQQVSRSRITKPETIQPDIPILKTKLFIPKVPRTIVERPHLIALLDQGAQFPMTILSAPAGFGKTTMLAEWAVQTQQLVAWVGLDKGDNDPNRLINYLIRAVQNALNNPTVGSESLELLRSPTPLPVEMVLSPFVNDLIQIPTPVVLIFDDYHNIKEKNVHNVVHYILEHQPDSLRLILSTRVDPPLHLARMRANNLMFEIRTESLRFNLVEADTFLNKIMGLELLEEDIAVLSERTEGWIAGYKMVSLALQQRGIAVEPQNRRQFIFDLSGSQRFIFDYLVEEVLSGQPNFIRSFLMKTSILDRFCASLCEAVAGPIEQLGDQAHTSGETTEVAQNYQQILEYLDHANMFLIPMDEERCWYRYHHLFIDILQARLQQTEDKSFIQQLHKRASVWLESNKFPYEAIYHAHAAADFDRTARLVEVNYIDAWEWNKLANIGKWIDKLPQEVVLKRHKLCCYHAYVEMLKGKIEGLEVYLDSAQGQLEEAAVTEENEETLAVLNLTRAYIAGLRGNWAYAIELAKTPLTTTQRYRSAYNLMYGFAFFLEGELERSRSAFKQLIYDNIFLLPGSLSLSHSYLARIYKLEGRLNEAEQVYTNALKVITERGWNQFYIPALIEFGLSDLLLEKNEADKAWYYVQHGLENTGSWFPADSLATGYTVLSRVLQRKGDYSAALSAVQEAEEKLKGDTLLPHIRSELEASSIRACLAQGDLECAGDWMQAHASILSISENENSGVAFRNEYDRIIALRILLAHRKFDEAVILAKRMIEIAKSGMRYGRVIEIEALLAIALQGSDEALQTLMDSLILAQPGGYARIFLDEGTEMQALLQKGKQRGVWQDLNLSSYVEKLLEP